MRTIFTFMFVTGLMGLFVFGYIINIIKLVEMCCGLSGELVARTIGVLIPPFGALVGFI